GSMGYTYRLTNVQAAIGCGQLEQLAAYAEAKRAIARRYEEAFGTVPGLTPMREAPWARSAFWMYTLLVDPGRFPLDSRALLRRLEERRIQARPLWQPLHLALPYRECPQTDCSVAERLHREALSLPCSVGLGEEDQRRVVEAV